MVGRGQQRLGVLDDALVCPLNSQPRHLSALEFALASSLYRYILSWVHLSVGVDVGV